MELLCVDDKFSADILEFYRIHGVVTPKERKIYTLRDYIKHTNGSIGILLQEIINPKVPIKHPILGTINMEPTWALRRFCTLDGTTLEESMLKIKEELIK